MATKKFKLNASVSANSPTENEPVKFSIVANTGAVMTFGAERIAVDVNGVTTPKPSIPIIYGHDLTCGIGHSTSIIKSQDGKLLIEGVCSRKNKYSDDFVNSSRNGFPWEASIGGYVTDGVDIKAGDTYNLNGATIDGPCFIATKFELYECSIVEYGADPNTVSKVTASKELKQMEEEKKDAQTAEKQEVNAASVDNANAVDEMIKATREAQAVELKRIADIKARSIGNDEALQAKAIQEGWSADKFELEALRASRASAPAIHTPAQKVDSKGLEAAFVRACGFTASEKRYTDKELSAADMLGGLDFVEFCERAANANAYSFRKDSYRKICAAISTSNLGSVLTNAANAALLSSYDNLNTEWQKVFRVSSVSDFKTAERWRIDTNFAFIEVPEGGEMEHAEASDEKYEIKAKMWGRQFALSEQAIVNGDALGVFGELLRQISFGANEAICRECWSLFMAPSNTSDSKAFYHADHGSLLTSKALNMANLSTARASFISRKKAKGDEPLGIPPALLVVPTALEAQAQILNKSTTIYDAATGPATDYNPNAGLFEVVAVPYLGYANYTNYSDSTWYLLANPQRLSAFEIAFLNGRQAPIIRQDQMRIGTLGIEFDAHCAFGVAQEDYRGALKVTA